MIWWYDISFSKSDLQKRQTLHSFPKHNNAWKQELKITYVTHMEPIVWKHWVNIKSTKSLYKFKDFMKKWSGSFI